MMERRRALDGFLPERVERVEDDRVPAATSIIDAAHAPAPARRCRRRPRPRSRGCCATCCKDPEHRPRVVPIIPDEARTFGIDALFARVQDLRAVRSAVRAGRRRAAALVPRGEATASILEEGITEAGAMASFTAAGTAYATWGQPMIPFFIFYSMFGFQRVGDLIWSFGDQRGRGLPARRDRRAAPRSPARACSTATASASCTRSAYPNCRAYDPAFAYEVGVHRPRRHRAHVRRRARGLLLLPHALQRELRAAADARGRRGRHRPRPVPLPRRAGRAATHRAQILASGTDGAARRSRRSRCSPTTTTSRADVWSVPGWKQLRDDALDVERWNRLHPTEPPRTPYVTEQLGDAEGPIVAVTDWVKAVPD